MQAAELTLTAAITDSRHRVQAVRHHAVRNLAPALLAELGRVGPAWNAARDHPRGDAVLSALREAIVAEDDAALAGIAAIGLGWLGAPEAVWWTEAWLDRRDDDDTPERGFLRECAVIAISYVGAAAPEHEAALIDTITQRLRTALQSPYPDLRFQAATALVEVAGSEAEPAVLVALGREDDPAVRAELVAAISRIEHPSIRTLDVLERLLTDDHEREREATFEAALVLAAAGRGSAGPRLLEAIARRWERDRALEALAVIAPALGPEGRTAVHALATSVFVPAITRVRAAYALARLDGPGSTGRTLLRWLAWHPRPAVREAVRDADAALRELASR